MQSDKCIQQNTNSGLVGVFKDSLVSESFVYVITAFPREFALLMFNVRVLKAAVYCFSQCFCKQCSLKEGCS